MASARFDNTDGRLRGRKLQARRLRVWTANPYCACGCGRLTEYPDGFQLDHKVPLYKGGEDTDENCQVLTPECHDKKTMQDMGFKERVEFDASGHVVW